MSNSQTFTDAYGDKLEVENFGGSAKDGVICTKQNGKSSVFGLKKDHRLPMAELILKPLDAVVVEGPLPDVKVTEYNGTKRVSVGGHSGEISEAEKDYFLTQARQALSMAKAIERLLEQEEKERQERLAAAEKRKARRDVLAREFANTPWANYSTAPTSTKTAIDRIIELEDAAK